MQQNVLLSQNMLFFKHSKGLGLCHQNIQGQRTMCDVIAWQHFGTPHLTEFLFRDSEFSPVR